MLPNTKSVEAKFQSFQKQPRFQSAMSQYFNISLHPY